MQVFLNLIVNAEQAIREAKEGGILRVRLGCEAGGKGRVWVSFEDNGAGIPPDLVSKIFDPFFTTKRPGRGTGLGLSICLALVREHRGNIEVQSTVGRGTTITVSLPVAEELPATQSAAFRTAPAPLVGGAQGPTPGGGAAGAELKGHSILVVDDEESIRELIETGLSARGVQVHCVSSGEEALDRTKNSAFDAILCDVKMPGLSGEQVYAQLRARPEGKNQRFIFMTGDWVDSETLSFLKGSGARVVQKPFRISDLVAVLTEVVGSRTGPESSRVN
jgi:CheY-like chemotaxis protein